MAFDAFLKFEAIPGESTDDKHKDWIEVVSFSWGGSQPGLGNGAGTGSEAKAAIHDFSVVKQIDAATAKLLEISCGGGTLPSAVLSVQKVSDVEGQPLEFLKIKFTDLIVSSISQGGNTQTEPLPLEQVSLNFSKIELAYTSASGDTVVGACGAGFGKADLQGQ